jgi:Flp pilus assembly protein TadG
LKLTDEKGQAIVEFALILPILLLLLCGIIDFGWIFGNQLLSNNASREAARYTAIHYYDSHLDDDAAIAAEIVSKRAPTLKSPSVALTKDGDSITIKVESDVPVLTPIISSLFDNGSLKVTGYCTMRLE